MCLLLYYGDASKKGAVGGACLQSDHAVFESFTKVSPLRFFGRMLTLGGATMNRRELLALLVGYKSSYDFVFGKHVIFLPLAHEPLLTLQRLKVEHPFDPCPGEC